MEAPKFTLTDGTVVEYGTVVEGSDTKDFSKPIIGELIHCRGGAAYPYLVFDGESRVEWLKFARSIPAPKKRMIRLDELPDQFLCKRHDGTETARWRYNYGDVLSLARGFKSWRPIRNDPNQPEPECRGWEVEVNE